MLEGYVSVSSPVNIASDLTFLVATCIIFSTSPLINSSAMSNLSIFLSMKSSWENINKMSIEEINRCEAIWTRDLKSFFFHISISCFYDRGIVYWAYIFYLSCLVLEILKFLWINMDTFFDFKLWEKAIKFLAQRKSISIILFAKPWNYFNITQALICSCSIWNLMVLC